jgi:hypothetical protein
MHEMNPYPWRFEEESPMGNTEGSAYAKAVSSKGKPKEHALVREAAQNSMDAAGPGATAPVKLVVRRERLGPSRISSFAELTRIGTDFEPRLDKLKLPSSVTINNLLNAQAGVDILYIEDFNTIGLGGPLTRNSKDAHFRKLALSLGVGDKLAAGSTGGSYGFGKAVYSGSSDCKTVFFYSTFEPTEDTEGSHARLMGCAYFKGHQHDGKDFTGRAWWGVPQDDGRVTPYLDDEAHELAERLGFTRRTLNTTGASILVVGCGILNMSEIRKAFELYWWPSIVDHAFDVELIDDGTPVDPPQPKQNSSIRPFVKAYELFLGMQKTENRVAAKKDIKGITADTKAGTWAAVFIDREVFDGDDELLDSIALMRKPRMVVKYDKVGKEYLPGFASVFVASDEADPIFKKSEPQEHDIWDEHHDELNQFERDFVSKSMKTLKKEVREFQRNLKPPAPPGGIQLPQLQKLLGSVFKAKGLQKIAPRRIADPVHIHIEPNRYEENGQAKIQAKIKIRLKDEYKKDELPARVSLRIPVLANDNQTADDMPIPFRCKPSDQLDYGDYVDKVETQEVLKKDETLEFCIESIEFPAYQVTRLDVFCGQGKGEEVNG